MRNRFRAQILGLAGGLAAVFTAGCDEQLPTFGFPRDLPIDATSFEVRIPLEDFASNIRVVGGYGLTADLLSSTVARDFGGSLTAHLVARADSLPSEIVTPDSTDTVRVDTLFTIPGGRLIVRIDTLGARPTSDVKLVAEGIQQSWDYLTATWKMAVDSLNRAVEWTEPGAGPGIYLGEGSWDSLAEGSDSILISLDSAGVALLQDLDQPAPGGFRIRMDDVGERIRIRSVTLEGDARPSVKPDTLVQIRAPVPEITFVYNQGPEPRGEEWIVGSAPSFRTVFDVSIPTEIDGDPELCAMVQCPVTLTPEVVLFAALVLAGAPVEPQFQPLDTLLIDARGVVDPDRLPRSPLSAPVIALSARPGPELFRPEEGGQFEIGLTFYVQDLIRGSTPIGDPVFPTLALLTPIEPFSFEVMRFQGAGMAGAPYLRLLLTVSDQVGLE